MCKDTIRHQTRFNLQEEESQDSLQHIVRERKMRFPSPLRCLDPIWKGNIFSVARCYRCRASTYSLASCDLPTWRAALWYYLHSQVLKTLEESIFKMQYVSTYIQVRRQKIYYSLVTAGVSWCQQVSMDF